MYLCVNCHTPFTCEESLNRFRGMRDLLRQFDAGHQASGAERGRQELKPSVFSSLFRSNLKNKSLFWNRKTPFHAEPLQNIVQGKAKISITPAKVKVQFGKKSFNPMIMDWLSALPKLKVPWMNNKLIEYSFE